MGRVIIPSLFGYVVFCELVYFPLGLRNGSVGVQLVFCECIEAFNSSQKF